LLGHLWHLLSASGVGAVLDCANVPLLSGALAAAAAGHVPGGSRKNQSYVKASLSGADTVESALLTVLGDAQTSGGLLLCVDFERADALVAELSAPACVIGRLTAENSGRISLG
jgi:selenide,water dikinase